MRDHDVVVEEMILSDLAVIKKRIEGLSKDVQRGRKELASELDLLQHAQMILNDGKPLRPAGTDRLTDPLLSRLP